MHSSRVVLALAGLYAVAASAASQLVPLERHLWDGWRLNIKRAAEDCCPCYPNSPTVPTTNSTLFDVTLGHDEDLIWTSPNNTQLTTVLFNVVPAPGQRIIDMEKFSSALVTADCSEHFSLQFSTQQTFKAAKASFGWVNGGANRTFILVGDSVVCHTGNRRIPWAINHATFNATTRTIRLTAVQKLWVEAASVFTIDFGVASPGLQRRRVGFDKAGEALFDLSSSWPTAMLRFLNPNPLISINVDCENCGTRGTLAAHGHIKWSVHDGFEIFELRAEPRGVAADVHLKLDMSGKADSAVYDLPGKDFKVAEIPLPGEFEIPDILKLGPSMEVGIGFELDSIEGEATITTGATASIPDTALAKVDFAVDSPEEFLDKGEFYGWFPEFEVEPLGIDAQLGIGLKVSLEFNVSLGVSLFPEFELPWVKVPEEGFEMNLIFKHPIFSFEGKAGHADSGYCPPDPRPNGVKLDVNVGSAMSVDGVMEFWTGSKDLFNIDLWEDSDDQQIVLVNDYCKAFGPFPTSTTTSKKITTVTSGTTRAKTTTSFTTRIPSTTSKVTTIPRSTTTPRTTITTTKKTTTTSTTTTTTSKSPSTSSNPFPLRSPVPGEMNGWVMNVQPYQYWENDHSLDRSSYLLYGDQLTRNTKCITVASTSEMSTLTDLTTIPVDAEITFDTSSGTSTNIDSCCLAMFETSNCDTTRSWNKTCQAGGAPGPKTESETEPLMATKAQLKSFHPEPEGTVLMDSRAGRANRSTTFSLIVLFVAVISAARWYSSADSQTPVAVKTSTAVIDPLTADVRDLQSALESGILRSVDLVQLYTDQIQKHDDYLKAMINFKPLQSVLKVAEILDKERSEGKTRGPLHGIPIVIKGGFVPLLNGAGLIARQDNIDTHPDLGFQTTAGSYALVDSWPQKNAKIVDLLLAAGVIIIGKTNLSELSNYKGINITSGYSAVGGQVRSAYVRGDVDPENGRDSHSNPSGSSSGSAVAVSAGYSPFSIGTETDGSLVVPAGRAALYTMKPTICLVPQAGIVPISPNFDSAGPMAKTPYDLAVLLDAIVDPERKPLQSYTSALTQSWSEISVATLDPEVWHLPDTWLRPVKDAMQQMNREIRQAYAKIEKLAKSYAGNVPLIAYDSFILNGQNSETVVAAADFAKSINAYLETRVNSTIRNLQGLIEFNEQHAELELSPYSPNQERLTRAYRQSITAEEYNAHFAHLRHVARDRGIDFILDTYQVDVIMAPADSLLISYAACSGYPIATLPLSYLKYNGRPFGLSVVARANQEALLIKVQSAWEATFGPRKPPSGMNGRR